ncbi:hypothetical protein VCSRO44_1072 [Vibrio cholerae]|nr:hypothetical protein VCSRO44_1072 [Vibrio cholerae]
MNSLLGVLTLIQTLAQKQSLQITTLHLNMAVLRMLKALT